MEELKLARCIFRFQKVVNKFEKSYHVATLGADMGNLQLKEKLDQTQLALLATEMDKKRRSCFFAYFLLFF